MILILQVCLRCSLEIWISIETSPGQVEECYTIAHIPSREKYLFSVTTQILRWTKGRASAWGVVYSTPNVGFLGHFFGVHLTTFVRLSSPKAAEITSLSWQCPFLSGSPLPCGWVCFMHWPHFLVSSISPGTLVYESPSPPFPQRLIHKLTQLPVQIGNSLATEQCLLARRAAFLQLRFHDLSPTSPHTELLLPFF